MYICSGTSAGYLDGTIPKKGYRQRSIWQSLDEAKISYKIYIDEKWKFLSNVLKFRYFYDRPKLTKRISTSLKTFFIDAKDGTLPQYSFIDTL